MDFDFNKLYQNSLDNIFTDLELVIEDSNSTIRLNVHKIILICSSEYFHKMLLFDKSKTVQHMYVDNVQIMRDVILSFYGIKDNARDYPKWKYLLETMKWRNYLCLSNDASLLYDLNVPADGFELLLEVLELFDVVNDRRLLRVIKSNLPKNYDLGNFSSELINELFNSNLIVSGGADCSIKIWDAHTGQIVNTLNGHTSEVNSIAFSDDDLKIVSGSNDHNIKIWDAKTGQLIRTLGGCPVSGFTGYTGNPAVGECEALSDRQGHTDLVRCVAFSNGNQKIISGSDDWSIKIWDAKTGQLIRTLNNHTGPVRSVAFSTDSQKIVSGSNDRSIKIWDADSGQLINTLNGNGGWILSVVFSHDSQKIISGSNDHSIKIWDTKSGQLINTLKGHIFTVNSVAFSNNSQKIVSGSDDCSIKIWDAESGQLIRTLTGHNNSVHSVAFSSNDQKIVSCSRESIKIWDTNTGQLINTLYGHSRTVRSVVFSNY